MRSTARRREEGTSRNPRSSPDDDAVPACLRVSEAIGLRRDDVNLEQARVWVRRLKNSLSVEHPIAGDELRAIKRYLATREEAIVLFEWDGKARKPIFKAVMPLATGRNYAGEFLCLDLAFEPSVYTSLSAEELVENITIGSRPRPICPVRLNAMPIVFALNDPLVASRIPCRVDVLMSRVRQLQADPGLRERILLAADARRAQFSQPQHVDEQLYSGGFITEGDMLKLEQFHRSDSDEKMHIIAGLKDPRLLRLATRVMYEESPSALPSGTREQLAIEVAGRLTASPSRSVQRRV